MVQNGWSTPVSLLCLLSRQYFKPRILASFLPSSETFFYQLIYLFIFIFPGIRVSPTFPNSNSMNSEMVEKEPFCAFTTNKSLFTCVSIYDIFIFYIL